MSKETLIQMKRDYKNAFPINIEWLLEYAKEQAKRAEELEEKNKLLKQFYRWNTDEGFNLMRQVNRYQQGLEEIIKSPKMSDWGYKEIARKYLNND